MIYLTVADLLHIAERAMRAQPVLRDAGLLEAACARPAASVFGADAYPTLDLKAAALVHSLARNHPLVDGNKRLALGALIGFLGLNGRRLLATNNEAYDLIIEIARGELDDVACIAVRIDHEASR